VLLEQTQGGHALASNSHRHGGRYASSLRLARGEPASFTANVSPESEFVRWEFYRRDESQPFLTVDKTRVDLHWTQAANAVARVVTRPKDEYKLLLETKVADSDDPDNPDTPGDDCPGYVVVENARTIGTISYHGPKRYYPKDGWVRLRPVANPGYRFVKWETSEDVTGITLEGLWWWSPPPPMAINGLEDERIAVRMQADTTITAVFEWDPIKVVQLAQGDLPEREIRQRDDPDTPDVREDVATISAAPAMPQLLVRLNGGRADVAVQWRMEVEHTWTRYDRRYSPPGSEIQSTVHYPSPPHEATFTEPQPSNQAWTVAWNGDFVGGEATIYARFCNCNQAEDEENPVTLKFTIWGTNPELDDAENYITENSPHWFAPFIVKQESEFRHFEPDFQYDELEIGEFRNTNDGGVGMMQLTNPVPDYPNQHWSWHANANEGLTRLNGMVTGAENYLAEQRRNALGQVGYRDYDEHGNVIVNEHLIPVGDAKPVPTTTESGVTFGDAEDADHRPEDAVAIKRYNGATPYNYWRWQDQRFNPDTNEVTPGHWVLSNIAIIRGREHNYVAAVCSHVPQN